jgi:hypothetical protein
MNRQSGVAAIVRATAHHVPASQHKSLQTPPYFIDLESLLLGNAVLTKASSCRKQKRTVGTSASLHHDTVRLQPEVRDASDPFHIPLRNTAPRSDTKPHSV